MGSVFSQQQRSILVQKLVPGTCDIAVMNPVIVEKRTVEEFRIVGGKSLMNCGCRACNHDVERNLDEGGRAWGIPEGSKSTICGVCVMYLVKSLWKGNLFSTGTAGAEEPVVTIKRPASLR